MTEEILLRGESNSVYYILRYIQLLLSLRGSISFSDTLASHQLLLRSENDLEQVGKILSIKDLRRTAWHFLNYGASTAYIIQRRLELAEATTYRYLKDLRAFNFIVPAIRSRSGRGKRGPRIRVWMVPDATTSDINEAQKLHKNLMSPTYRYAEEMAQLMLDDYILVQDTTEFKEVNYIAFLREKKVKTHLIPDIVMISRPYFREKGYNLIG